MLILVRQKALQSYVLSLHYNNFAYPLLLIALKQRIKFLQ